MDKIVVMKEGTIDEIGTFDELISQGCYFAQEFMVSLERQASSNVDELPTEKPKASKDRESGVLVQEEDRETQGIKLSLYYDYFAYSGGIWSVICIVAVALCWLAANAQSDLSLAEWVSSKTQIEDSMRYIMYYSIFSILSHVLSAARGCMIRYLGLNVSSKIYKEMLKSLLDAPINRYFDINPLGRIITRFTNEIGSLQGGTFWQLSSLMSMILNFVFALCMVVYTIPYILFLLPLVAYAHLWVSKRVRNAKLDLQRINAITNTPVMQNITESLRGDFVIRAHNETNRYIEKNEINLDENNKHDYMNIYLGKWQTCYSGFANIALTMTSVTCLVLLKGQIEPAFAAVCFYKVQQLGERLMSLCFSTGDFETCMVPFERAMAFTRIESEAPRVKEGDDWLKDLKWPQGGAIQIKNLTMRYRDDLDIVLKGINMRIEPNEKVGICGRTGSGKSSLTMSLFRIVEPLEGSIEIDTVDISKVGLDMLRSKLCLIPQDPTLFQGTLRFNLDPYNRHSDSEMETALTDVDYYHEGILDLKILENGKNLSVGQKQQICLARALLRQAKIMVLDEATASIDFKTDEIIQNVISEKFKECTVLTIAHRINTIIHYDKIACLAAGRLVEFGSPYELLEKKGLFYELVHG